ncbi:phosphoribosylformylglycinamidine cyclo-ligase [Candidatus Falkowbacteria bacterium]|nr:phosphoribosylformylglycinamidine cyclo-ligase [Candidatus Falkowbacteria bacterium]
MKKGMTYSGVGVNYDAMDPFKRAAQKAGLATSENILRLNMMEFEASRGESAYLIERSDCFLAHVEEGLGTKNLVAEIMYKLTGQLFFGNVAQCTVAMIVNDMITLGALPISLAMHLAVGSSKWFDDKERAEDLVAGWKKACDLARCAWGGGETPTLRDIVGPETVVLSGSAIGIIEPKSRLIRGNIQDGDAIIIFLSSGIHANGLTLAREIASKLPRGYLTLLEGPGGGHLPLTYGEVLLKPTTIYVPVIEDCLDAGIDIHYAVNITGHGWRKLMRHTDPFVYIVEEIPTPQPIFRFMQEHGPVSDEEAYGNLNMGAGFALYVSEKDVKRVMQISEQNQIPAMVAGHIEKKGNQKKVIIKPKNITFAARTLKVR